MALDFACGDCGHKMRAPDQMAGRRINCKKCGESVRIPPKLVEPQYRQPPRELVHVPPPPVSAPPPIAIQVNVPGHEAPRSSSMSIASMVLGIMALALFCFPIIALPLSLVGCILAVAGFAQNRDSAGFAIAGGAMSAIALCVSGFFLVTMMLAMMSRSP